MASQERDRIFLRRRMPRQRRSQLLYDKILDTAESLFKRHGYAYVTTNHIAEKANVSIGSVYQYFASREAIALAVYESACAAAALTMKRETLDSLSSNFEDVAPRLTMSLFEVFEKDRYALLQLITEVPELKRIAQPFSFETLMHRTTQVFFEHYFPDVNAAVLARKSYIVNICVFGIIRRYLDERPDFLKKSQMVSEIGEMITPYINSLALLTESLVSRRA
jgi:AcrR family transcriptional regulator